MLQDRWTPLHVAANNGKTDVMEILASFCATVDVNNNVSIMMLCDECTACTK